jgi:hypothetical protein
MRDSVLAAIEERPAAEPTLPFSGSGTPAAHDTPAPGRQAGRAGLLLFRPALRVPVLAAAAVVLAFAGLAAWSAYLQVQVHDLKYGETQARSIGVPVAQHDALLLLASPGTVRSQLQPQAGFPDASGMILWNPRSGQCVVFTNRLQPLDADHEYHVWFHSGSHGWDGGRLNADEQGSAEAAISTNRWQIGDSYSVSVVVQPHEGGGAPQTVLTGQVAATTQ